MAEHVSRTLDASKKKMAMTAKERASAENSGEGARFRNTPAGRRLAELAKKKLDESD